jgi:thioredoxin reductase (NADPH)
MEAVPREGPASQPTNPTDPYVRRAQTFPGLADEQVERAAEFGVVEAVTRGTALFDRGDRAVDFFIVLEGLVEIYDPSPHGSAVVTTLGESQFTGELELFNDRGSLVGARMATTGRVVRTRRAQFRRMLVAEPDIAEIIMRALILRRIGLLEHEQGASLVIGARTSGDTLRIHRFLDRNGYPLRALDPQRSQEAREAMAAHGLVADDLPAVVTASARVLRNPTNRELATAVGLVEELDPETLIDCSLSRRKCPCSISPWTFP